MVKELNNFGHYLKDAEVNECSQNSRELTELVIEATQKARQLMPTYDASKRRKIGQQTGLEQSTTSATGAKDFSRFGDNNNKSVGKKK